MRVLLIGHAYLLWKEFHKKLGALSKIDPDLDLYLLVPSTWKHQLKAYELGDLVGQGYHVLPTEVSFGGVHWRYFFLHPTIHLERIKPDIIQVDQEPTAIAFFQAMVMRRLLCPKAKVVFFVWQNIYRKYSFYRELIQRFNLNQADYAIAGNQEAVAVLRRKGYRGPVAVMPQFGVDECLFRKVDVSDLKCRLGLGSPLVGFVGRFVEEKGVVTLIKALAKMDREVQLLLVGGGNLEPQMRRLAGSLGMGEKLVFAGVVPSEELPAYLNCMDVLVLPSVTTPSWKEQFGHVLIEAMSCQVPVIGSDSGEIPNVIADAGLIFHEKDSTELKEKLTIILDNPALRTELGRKGRAKVLCQYTHEAIARQTHQIYREIMNHSPEAI